MLLTCENIPDFTLMQRCSFTQHKQKRFWVYSNHSLQGKYINFGEMNHFHHLFIWDWKHETIVCMLDAHKIPTNLCDGSFHSWLYSNSFSFKFTADFYGTTLLRDVGKRRYLFLTSSLFPIHVLLFPKEWIILLFRRSIHRIERIPL